MRLIDAEYLLYGMGVFSEKENGTEFMKGVDAVAKMIDDAPTIAQSGWTPCAEGMPKEDMAVYVSYEVFGNYYPTIAFIRNGEWANIYGYPMHKEKVVAWLHLPEPYNPDTAKED